ncbi:hypothetical protein OYE22_30500 [Streptomyces sp. 71268]|nr:hypothetical protein [Streptomyces sp. 71268]WEV29032.1 hypothetical protein OYE22_30500 [Streptomyces sp. 71268]
MIQRPSPDIDQGLVTLRHPAANERAATVAPLGLTPTIRIRPTHR